MSDEALGIHFLDACLFYGIDVGFVFLFIAAVEADCCYIIDPVPAVSSVIAEVVEASMVFLEESVLC